jgi:hypothetical protein
VRQARIFGCCHPKRGIAPFDRHVAEVMAKEPYRSARRVFWLVDNGSSHRGQRSIERLAARWPRRPALILVHVPIHASWLNRAEIYFSVVQRKVLQPNDVDDLAALEARLRTFERHYDKIAKPFAWTFTRRDLDALMAKVAAWEEVLRLAA